ncbi:MAG TPA: hypothetical protein VFM36_14590 [Thermoanaerobaculia bacterium]|nr:hypothetical protein [Thermoanaerobaculia bacterium]
MRIVTTLSRFLLAAFWSLTAVAGTRFDFVAEAPGYTYKGQMSMDGKRLRLDMTEGNHPLFNEKVSIISREAGTEVLVLDHATRTYFQRQVAHIGGPLSTARGIGSTRASQSKFSKTREPIDERGATERHTIRAQYHLDMTVQGEKLQAEVVIEAIFDIDPDIVQIAHPWGLQYAAKTGFERIDDAMARQIPNRLPLRQVVTVTRQIEGGAAITEQLTITVSNVREEEIPNGEFYAPDGYPYREPVFTF